MEALRKKLHNPNFLPISDLVGLENNSLLVSPIPTGGYIEVEKLLRSPALLFFSIGLGNMYKKG